MVLTPSDTASRDRVGPACVYVCTGLAAVEVVLSPNVHGYDQRLALGVDRPGAREGDRQGRHAGRDVGGGVGHGRLVRLDVADAAELADAELTADVGVAEVEVVQGAVGTLGQVDDVAVRAVDGSVGRLEVEDSGDVAVGVERQPLDPVLRVVGEEVAAVVRRPGTPLPWYTNPPVMAASAPVVGIRVERAGARRRAVALAVRPAVVGAGRPRGRPLRRPSSSRCRRRRR